MGYGVRQQLCSIRLRSRMSGASRLREQRGSPLSHVNWQVFKIGFDPRDKARVFEYWNQVFESQKWTEGAFTALFEGKWSAWNGMPAVATSSWAGAAMACLEHFGVRGRKVLCPTNTFMATPLAVVKSGAEVVFADCNRTDLCLSHEAVVSAAAQHDLAAVWLVHIGGHIAFDTPRIAEFCRARGIVLLEDCAHGASWHDRKPGSRGDAGVYSFYGTKTISTGEGGGVFSAPYMQFYWKPKTVEETVEMILEAEQGRLAATPDSEGAQKYLQEYHGWPRTRPSSFEIGDGLLALLDLPRGVEEPPSQDDGIAPLNRLKTTVYRHLPGSVALQKAKLICQHALSADRQLWFRYHYYEAFYRYHHAVQATFDSLWKHYEAVSRG
jgi:hypothetical protein